MALDFLTPRVQNPGGDDYKKLAHMICYIRVTLGMELTLKAESIDNIRWWIEAAYWLHPDLKVHSSGMMLLGKGAAASLLSMHRINSRRSTESEIIGFDCLDRRKTYILLPRYWHRVFPSISTKVHNTEDTGLILFQITLELFYS